MEPYLSSHAPYIILGVFFAGVFALILATAVADWVYARIAAVLDEKGEE